MSTLVKAQIGIAVIAVHLSFTGTAEEFIKNNSILCVIKKKAFAVTFKVIIAIKSLWKICYSIKIFFLNGIIYLLRILLIKKLTLLFSKD